MRHAYQHFGINIKPPIYVVFYAIRALSQSSYVFIKKNIHIPGSH